jgi:hypothetical protein
METEKSNIKEPAHQVSGEDPIPDNCKQLPSQYVLYGLSSVLVLGDKKLLCFLTVTGI